MGQARSEGSVYQVKSGRDAGKWRGSIVVGWKRDGKPIRVGVMRTTEVAARRAMRDLLNRRDANRVATRPSGWTIPAWMEHWMTRWQDDKRPPRSTVDSYKGIIRTHITPAFEKVRLTNFTEKHYRQLMAGMNKRGLSASRRRVAHSIIHQALRLAVQEKLLGYNPIEYVSAAPIEKREVEVPSKEDVAAILEVVAGDPMAARWLLALDIGLRQSEALGLRLSSVDLDAGTISITHQLRRIGGVHGCATVKVLQDGRRVWPCGQWFASKCPTGTPGGLALLPLKSKRAKRTVPITSDLLPILREHMAARAKSPMIHGKAYRGWTTEVDGRRRKVDLLFAQWDGRPIQHHQDWVAWHQLIRDAGLADTEVGATRHRLHGARHAAVVNMIDSGVPLGWVSEIVGHASHSFTADTYGHLEADTARRAADAISAGRARARDDLAEKRRRKTPKAV